jgi:DNA-binding beta-propeller fold protein YncE
MMPPLHVLLALLLGAPSTPDTGAVVWPSAPDRPRVRFVRSLAGPADFRPEKSLLEHVASFLFGGEASPPWLVQPVGIAVSPAGLIAVADPGARGVHLLHPGDRRARFLGESADGPLRSPVGAAFAGDGSLYITDADAGTVAVFDADGEPDGILGVSFTRPTGIAVAGDTVYVVDTGTHEIVVCTRAGGTVRRWGTRGTGPGEFNYPVHVAAGGDLYVVDALNFRVQRCAHSGAASGGIGSHGTGRGAFAGPKAAALDGDGHVYVTDALKDNIQVFSPEGALLLVVGGPGTGPGQFQSPSGIAVDRDDRIYVVDALNRRIQILEYLR